MFAHRHISHGSLQDQSIFPRFFSFGFLSLSLAFGFSSFLENVAFRPSYLTHILVPARWDGGYLARDIGEDEIPATEITPAKAIRRHGPGAQHTSVTYDVWVIYHVEGITPQKYCRNRLLANFRGVFYFT